jgi:hypothetical protein
MGCCMADLGETLEDEPEDDDRKWKKWNLRKILLRRILLEFSTGES